MMLDVEGFRLTWTSTTGGAELTVLRDAGRLPPFALSMRFVVNRLQRRLPVTMAFPPTNRLINISSQPGLLSQALADSHDQEDHAPGLRHAVIGGWISELAEQAGAWRPGASQYSALDAIVGGAAFPMLGAAYERGAAPLREIPMWAATILGQPTARAASQVAFAAKATRPVISAFASNLTRRAHCALASRDRPTVNITGLALGLMGSAVLEADQVVRILESAMPGSVPSGEQIADCRKVATRLGPWRAERILTDAGESDGGLTMLNQMVEMYLQVGHLLRDRPENRLEALHGQCRALMPRDPNPGREHTLRPQQRATRRRQVVPLPGQGAARPRQAPTAAHPTPLVRHTPRPGAEQGRNRALLPPPVLSPVTNTVLQYPADIRALDHTDLGALRLVLPRTTSELTTWGRLLGNCVGSFGSAAAAGRSWLVGVEANDRLTYCLELSPDRLIRQFLAIRNGPVPPDHARQVVRHLANQNVIDPTNQANRLWS